eukprot:341601-Lingulodinium_polyedra.AAC.1
MLVRGAAQESFAQAISAARDAALAFVMQAPGAEGEETADALRRLECCPSGGAAVEVADAIANGVAESAINRARW